jgi:hypothetical protein
VTASLRFDALADALADLPNLAERLGLAWGGLNPQGDEARRAVVGTLGAALALALRRAGWSVRCDEVGEPITLRRGAEGPGPWDLVRRLSTREEPRESWRAKAVSLGLDDLSLADCV